MPVAYFLITARTIITRRFMTLRLVVTAFIVKAGRLPSVKYGTERGGRTGRAKERSRHLVFEAKVTSQRRQLSKRYESCRLETPMADPIFGRRLVSLILTNREYCPSKKQRVKSIFKLLFHQKLSEN